MFVNNILEPIQVRLSPNLVSHTLGHRENNQISSVLYCVQQLCTMIHTYEQFLNLRIGLGLDFNFCVCLGLLYCFCVLC